MSYACDQISKEVAIKMYSDMVILQIMDAIFYEAQRQGRISFYLTTIGEEAINIASAAALNVDDFIFPQYREPGVLLWRGFTLQEFANQCFGNKADYGKGRQMPIHYGSKKHKYFTVSSPIATQISHAVGAAYSLKMDRRDACTVTYFGDGATSEALTYRVGHHSTSDDSTKYRPADEIEWWRIAQDPVSRFRKWLERNGWWSDEAESNHRTDFRKQILDAIQVAEKVEKPPIAEIFTDVYDVPPSNLCEQERLLRETIERHPQGYPPNVPV
ncbi:3-methyl-2-oxobutanoate dehydrogenase (2-methylpropanoyl-transferring) [Sarracenia purpurea var. burkii]